MNDGLKIAGLSLFANYMTFLAALAMVAENRFSEDTKALALFGASIAALVVFILVLAPLP
jgi:hypothetical protein